MTEASEIRRVEFTIPQYFVLAPLMLRVGIYQQSHRPLLDRWDAEALYVIADAELPFRNGRELTTRDSILSKLAWARPVPRAKTLAEVLSEGEA